MIEASEVAEAEAALAVAKGKYHGSKKAEEHKAEFKAAKKRLVEVRSAWRRQEELAGRRVGLVQGDAFVSTPEGG